MIQLLGQGVDLEMVQYGLVSQFGLGMGFLMVETDAAVDIAASPTLLG